MAVENDLDMQANEINDFYYIDIHDFKGEQAMALGELRNREGMFFNISSYVVKSLFKGINPRNASGPDGISCRT